MCRKSDAAEGRLVRDSDSTNPITPSQSKPGRRLNAGANTTVWPCDIKLLNRFAGAMSTFVVEIAATHLPTTACFGTSPSVVSRHPTHISIGRCSVPSVLVPDP
ncbi:unnamed protein product [Soboliphyme baturini]|uniref:Uncharacterized protein n=1 Tax=Soboliphyme baturini TaxID=241478 RepID=A0A183IKN0_9BILA|nr:unnamed protein product [Soboliphyme baturini]